ncbi:nicotinate phosphoribosyltransferase [Paraburkholderia graminis]|uniref:Nicotinate phosphoribosyltransferase n=1 Tax=Paraburkholderia graminis TaxID=60548 RepID=A0ABD5CF66_9BURK|nr:nicotinate phosphoribosyltransferase [Paraburkholderia graminis]MDR6203944.1 nicotinate phosphoribosyltransferase [Paraburkholderia graminis]
MSEPLPSLLLTDLYELTMLQAYFDCGMNRTATFEFFVRKLPQQRNFLVAAGLAQVLDYLAGLQFTTDDIRLLREMGRFKHDFLESLAGLRFKGDVYAMPEGSVFFPDEPISRITAPLREAQLVESRVMNLLHYETVVASKAARVVLAAPDELLVDFGLRRAHGAEAGMLSARASYLAGFSGTAAVLAGTRFDIPLFGTMAHSYVQAHADEADALEHFARSQPENATLLIDTYDTEAAAHEVVKVARRLQQDGIAIKAVRIDSGDLAEHARRVRAILDAGGLPHVTIFASGNLDEFRLLELLTSGAPIDGFGVGTRMNTSSGAPYLDCAYKLTEYDGQPRRKRSEGKATWPGRKQVYRHYDAGGTMTYDQLTVEDDPRSGVALLQPVMLAGKRTTPSPTLAESRAYARGQLDALPGPVRNLTSSGSYAVVVCEPLKALASIVDAGLHSCRGTGDATDEHDVR